MPVWRSTTYSWHYPEKEEESILLDNGRVQAVAQVTWAGRQQARRDFVGYPTLVNDLGLRWITRSSPMPWWDEKDANDRYWLYCTGSPRSVGLGPYGNDPATGLARYHKCHLTLQFQALTYDIVEDADVVATDGPLLGLPDEGDALSRGVRRYVSVHGKMGSKTWTVPQGILLFPDGQPILQGSFGKQIPFIDLVYTWHQVPDGGLPRNAWREAIGTVNDAEFDGWPAQTLLLGAPSHTPRRGVDGQRLYDVQYPMRFLPNWDRSGVPRGHNYMLRAKIDGGSTVLDYDLVKTKGTAPGGAPNGDTPFRTFDYRKLFRPDQP